MFGGPSGNWCFDNNALEMFKFILHITGSVLNLCYIFQGMLRGQYCVRDPNGGPPILGSFERNGASGNGAPNWSGRDVRNFSS